MNLLKKVANLVVEVPEDPAQPAQPAAAAPKSGDKFDESWAKLEQEIAQKTPKLATVEQIVKDAAGPNLEQVQVPVPPSGDPSSPPTSAMPAVQADGKVDFTPVYQSAKLPTVPFTAEDALGLIASLPAELPLETKRQTVKITLAAMGKTVQVSPQSIVTDAALKLAALQSFTQGIAKQATDYISLAELDIANMQAKIAERKKGIDGAKAKQAEVEQQCAAEADRLDDVAEFFSLDVPPSKLAAQR